MDKEPSLSEKVQSLQDMLISYSTNGGGDNELYKALREELVFHSSISPLLPSFLRTNRDLGQFWQFIKHKYSTYAERRQFIWSEFHPALERLEQISSTPADSGITETLVHFDTEYVANIWQQALQRRLENPEAAITSARTLLESVCKHILDDLSIRYDDIADLPKLYHLTAKELKLAPSEHTEQVFKQILGGCQTVVEGLGALRNRLGDAHGKGKFPVRPAARHAELAVNLSGSMATFLVQTWEQRKEKQ